MIKRTVPLLLLAALVLPTAAAAENTELSGPLLVKGRGALKGEVKMANPAETRPLVFAGKGGLVRFVDLAGDLRVAGHCRAVRAEGERRKAFVCMGRGGRARVHGSHFRIVARLRTYALAIPEGATAQLRGHYVTSVPGEESDRERERPRRERPEREQPRPEQPKQERPTANG
jgi:hypothetical protein